MVDFVRCLIFSCQEDKYLAGEVSLLCCLLLPMSCFVMMKNAISSCASYHSSLNVQLEPWKKKAHRMMTAKSIFIPACISRCQLLLLSVDKSMIC